METSFYLAAIREDADAMIVAAEAAGLDAAVSTCPGWSVEDLMVHTGIVHRHKTEIVLGNYVNGSAPLPENPSGDVLDWFADGVDEMIGVFESSDLSKPSWTWCVHDHTADWWVRRMAHETTIHGADAVIAAGQVPTIDASLATDGVDEILEEMMIGGPTWSTVTASDRTITLETSDRSWRLRTATFSGTSPTSGKVYDSVETVVFDESAEPEAVVGTDSETLDLWLWGRRNLPQGDVRGDRSLVSRVRSIAAEATQ